MCMTQRTGPYTRTVAHIVQAVRFRMWWLFLTAVFCGVSEVVGWSARVYSSSHPHALVPYSIQCVWSPELVPSRTS